MKEHFQLLKDSISLTKKSLETVANDSASEKRFVTNFVRYTLQANLIFIDALEVEA